MVVLISHQAVFWKISIVCTPFHQQDLLQPESGIELKCQGMKIHTH